MEIETKASEPRSSEPRPGPDSLVKQDSQDEPGTSFILDMTVAINESDSRVFKLPSNDPFIPELHQIGNDLDIIASRLEPKGQTVSFYPKNIIKNPPLLMERLCSRLQEKFKCTQTVVYLANSLVVTFNIPFPSSIPQKHLEEIVCDTIVVSQDSPVMVLTVAKSNSETQEYNWNITKALVSSVRNFTDEHFSALCGVLQETDLESAEAFDAAVSEISRTSSTFCNPDSLSMTELKSKHILKAVAASIALSPSVEILRMSAEDEEHEQDDLWFLTKEQFLLLTENIDTGELVVVWAGPRTGSSTLMVEVASRLERSGRTLLVSGSQHVCNLARKYKVCSRVLDRDEFLTLQSELGDMLNGVDHVVAEDVSESFLLKERKRQLWLFMKVQDKTLPISPKVCSVVQPSNESLVNLRPEHLQTVKLKIPVDHSDPWVYDFTVVQVDAQNVIVVIDPHNNRVKSFFTANGEIQSRHMLIDKGTKGITNLNNRAAITIPDCRIIRVLSVTPDLVPHSVIETGRRYYAITGLGSDRIAACAPKETIPCVDIIDYEGQILHSIAEDESGQKLFRYPLTIHATHPNILVYDKHHGSVICVHDQGQVKFKYSPEKRLENPCGMTMTQSGEILVAESRLHRIVLLNAEGVFVKEVLTRQDNIIFPYRLCCDSSGLLYAALHYKEVAIFKFEKQNMS